MGLIRSNGFIERVTATSVGVAYPAIAETQLGAFKVALPPSLGEQSAIVERIKSRTRSIEAAIERVQREIELAREYRTRLIVDVVTGRLDVRQAEMEEAEAGGDGLASLDGLVDALAIDHLADDEALEAAEETNGADD